MSHNLRPVKELDILLLVEEVLVDPRAPEQPDVAVVSDGALGQAGAVEESALGLRLTRRHHPGQPKQLQQLLTSTLVDSDNMRHPPGSQHTSGQ